MGIPFFLHYLFKEQLSALCSPTNVFLFTKQAFLPPANILQAENSKCESGWLFVFQGRSCNAAFVIFFYTNMYTWNLVYCMFFFRFYFFGVLILCVFCSFISLCMLFCTSFPALIDDQLAALGQCLDR